MPLSSPVRSAQTTSRALRPQSRWQVLGELAIKGLLLGNAGALLSSGLGIAWHGAHWTTVSGALNVAGIVLVCLAGSFVMSAMQINVREVPDPTRSDIGNVDGTPWRSILTCLIAGGWCFMLDALLRTTQLA